MRNKNFKELINTLKVGKPCFIIGNGINRYNQKKSEDDISWEGLLLEIYNDIVTKPRKFIPEGIALTEFFDVIDLEKDGKVKRSLQKEFARKLDFNPKLHHEIIVNKIQDLNVPILTTNFDFALERTVNAEMHRYRTNGLRLLSDFYPWDSYFSDSEKEDPFNAFSIWHMHGQKNYTRSIKLGLNQYLLMVDRAKRYFPNQKTENEIPNYSTWIKIFFERDIIIFGLGLNEQEVFIRWLLLQRAKFFKSNPDLKRNGFYINHSEPSKQNVGKKFFLESVGIKYVDFIKDHDGFYNGFWNKT